MRQQLATSTCPHQTMSDRRLHTCSRAWIKQQSCSAEHTHVHAHVHAYTCACARIKIDSTRGGVGCVDVFNHSFMYADVHVSARAVENASEGALPTQRHVLQLRALVNKVLTHTPLRYAFVHPRLYVLSRAAIVLRQFVSFCYPCGALKFRNCIGLNHLHSIRRGRRVWRFLIHVRRGCAVQHT